MPDPPAPDEDYWTNLIDRAKQAWAETRQDARDIQTGDFELSRLVPQALQRQPGPGASVRPPGYSPPPIGSAGRPLPGGISPNSSPAAMQAMRMIRLGYDPDPEPIEFGKPPPPGQPQEKWERDWERSEQETKEMADEERAAAEASSPETKRRRERAEEAARNFEEQMYQLRKTNPKLRRAL